MIQIRNDTCIEVYSDMNEWMDCVFLVAEADKDAAEKVLKAAFDDYWDDEEAHDACYGDWLELRMKKAKINYEVFYRSVDEEDM